MAENIFEKVLENVNIVDVVGKYVHLEPKGKNLFGICPFHNDTNPSMSVSSEKGIYNCFTCKNGGNAIKFIQDIEKLSAIDAARFLAKEYNIDISEFDHVKTDHFKKFYDMCEISQKFFEYVMNNENQSSEARKYLDSRGISSDIISEFGIGLSLDKTSALTEVLEKKGFIKPDIIQCSLATENSDMFIDRITVPIRNEQGKVIAFGGRIYKVNQNQNKYLNSRETPIFKKGQTVFNIDRVEKYLREDDFLIINEGYMDVIQSISKGINNCVALMGTAMTAEQAKLIAKYSKNVCIILDGDKPGVNAVASVYNRLSEAGVMPSICILPKDMDPDEFLRTFGKDDYLKYISENKTDRLGYYYYLSKSNYPVLSSFNMESFKREIFDHIKNETSKTVIESFLKRLSSDLNVSFDSVKQDFEVYSGKKVVQVKKNPTVTFKENKTSFLDKAEKMVIDYSIESYNYFSRIEDHMGSRTFIKNPHYSELFIEIGDIYDSNKGIKKDELIEALKERGVYRDYQIDKKIDYSLNDLVDNVLYSFKKAEIMEEINALKHSLTKGDLNNDASKSIQMEILRLTKELRKK